MDDATIIVTLVCAVLGSSALTAVVNAVVGAIQKKRGKATTQETHLAEIISTHAPAGGATAIFHKSVMRFCGKLPKDDTVLCLASFGFPRRDPKAVYLA